MHVTDFHPDPYYKAGATFESGCHRLKGEKPKSGKDQKGKGKSRLDGIWDTLRGEKKSDDDDDGEACKWGTPVS